MVRKSEWATSRWLCHPPFSSAERQWCVDTYHSDVGELREENGAIIHFKVLVPTLQHYGDCSGVRVLPGYRNSVCSYALPGSGMHYWPSWFQVWMLWSMGAADCLLFIQTTIWRYATTREWVRTSTGHLLHELQRKHYVSNLLVLWLSSCDGKCQ